MAPKASSNCRMISPGAAASTKSARMASAVPPAAGTSSTNECRSTNPYYWLANRPRTSEWTEIPGRLYRNVDAAPPAMLYSKWNPTEMLMEVQSRADKNS